MTLSDFIYGVYSDLMAGGWKMGEIDGMDIAGFLKVRAWEARREKKKKEPRRAYIDEVWKMEVNV